MKRLLSFVGSIILLCIFSCQGTKEQPGANTNDDNKVSQDQKEIQKLIIKTFNWSWSKRAIEMLPVIENDKDSSYTGIDLETHKTNLKKLKATHFFSDTFIENYNRIVLTIHQKLKNKEFHWNVGELPDFGDDAYPWTLTQDIPPHNDNTNPWDSVKVNIISLNKNKAELYCKLEQWKDWKYKFNVKKENGEWKISYMQGFDYNELIKN